MQSVTTRSSTLVTSDLFTQSFAWMFAGLLLTGVTSIALVSNSAFFNMVIGNPVIFYGAIIVELALVIFLSFRIMKMSFTTALISFLAYATLNGITLAAIFYVYASSSIASTFFVSSAVFGAMAFYGYTTKKDLTSIGSLAIMGLVGVIIASIVNIFLKNSLLDSILAYLGVAIFIGLTAYDTQKIKKMAAESNNQNLGILGALTLYLDFINLFLNLLRILGKRK